MSAALQERPRAGDRVRADVRRRTSEGVSTRSEMITLPDGCMVLTAEDLALLGNGDAAAGRRELRLMLEMERDRSYTVNPTPAAKPPNVRGAREADEPALVKLFMKDVTENAAHIAPADEERILHMIQIATQGKLGLCGVIDGPDGQPVAACVMHHFAWWWSRAYAVQEIALYVDSDYRNKGYLDDLLQFEKWAVDAWTKGFGYRVYLLCGVLGVHRIRAKIVAYRRKFRQCGAAFVYPSPYPSDTPTT